MNSYFNFKGDLIIQPQPAPTAEQKKWIQDCNPKQISLSDLEASQTLRTGTNAVGKSQKKPKLSGVSSESVSLVDVSLVDVSLVDVSSVDVSSANSELSKKRKR